MKKQTSKFVVIFIGLIIVLSLVSLFLLSAFKATAVTYGATFSIEYAEYLGLDWQDAFTESIEDLGITKFRIPVYWSEIETELFEFDFAELDWIMDTADEHDVAITLVVGAKVPRWPECFVPEWVEEYDDQEVDNAILDFVSHVVLRYRDRDSLERWQVENEPFFPFGDCPMPNPDRVGREIAVVKELDQDHPIQQTTSGEQSLWLLSSARADILGVSLYREVWSPVLGEFVFPYSSMFYNIQRVIAEPFVDKVIISELQAEPWLSSTTFESTHESVEEYYLRFPVKDLESNARFAKRTGVDEVYFWGIEWWYYLKEKGDDRLWEAGKLIINN